MTDDMQVGVGFVDDGSTDKIIKKFQQFDKTVGDIERSVDDLSDVFLKFGKQADGTFESLGAFSRKAEQLQDGDGDGGGGGRRSRGLGRGIGQLGRGIGGDLGNTVSQVGQLGQQAELLAGNSSKAALALGGAGIALAAISIGVKLFQNHLDKANEEFTRSLGVLEDLARVTAQGSDAASARVAQSRAEIAIQEQLRDEAQKTVDQHQQSKSVFSDVLRVIVPTIGALDLFTTGLDETAEAAVDAADDIIKSEQEVIDGLINEFGPALEDMAAQTDMLIADIDRLGEARKFEQTALAGSAEENQRRAETIANEKTIIQEQIQVIKSSGIETERAADKLEQLESEMEKLNQQTGILSSSAVKAAESQKTLAAAEEELKASAERSQRAIAAAVEKTSKARSQELKAAAEITEALTEARIDEQKLISEQMEDLADERESAHKKELKAEKDFQKTIRVLKNNQSFLELIDTQDKNTEEVDERRDERNDRLEDLQEGLIEEREMLALASAEAIKDKRDSLKEVKNRTLEAARDEQRIRNDASREIGEILNNRFRNEAQGYQQMGDIVAQFTEQMKASLAGLLDGGKNSRTRSSRRGDSQLTKQLEMIFN